MRKLVRALIVPAMLLTIGGCATLLKGSNEEVMVNSDPSGADVSINGQHTGTTPYVTTVPSSKDLQIEVSKPGYQAANLDDKTKFRWGYEIWSFVEFVIPMGVDLADGAAWGHEQTMVAAHLEPTSQPATAESTPAPSAAPIVGADHTSSPAK